MTDPIASGRMECDEVRVTRLLTVDEFASLARISRTHAYRVVQSGEVPVVKFGRCLRVPADAVDRLLSERLGPQNNSAATAT